MYRENLRCSNKLSIPRMDKKTFSNNRRVYIKTLTSLNTLNVAKNWQLDM